MNNNDNNTAPEDRQENAIILLTGFFGIVILITVMFLHYFGKISNGEFLCFSLFGFAALIFGLVMKRTK